MTADKHDIQETARELVAEGQGILAADESTGTMNKRLDGVLDGEEPTEELRLAFRELLFTTDAAAEHISGAILYDETIRQDASDGTPVPKLLEQHEIIPGIKVDTGAKPLAGSPDEKVTEGLDGLRERLEEYRELGARFAKWRAVITIGDHMPSQYCLDVNAHALARYAALCQEAGITPIVEPEVLMDGEHSIDRSEEVTEQTLFTVFNELHRQRIDLQGMLLKPNMIMSAYDAPQQADVDEVASRTLAVFHRVVPAAVGGIVFLSGGQSDEKASEHLNAMNNMGEQPWELSFSYGRALQGVPLSTWKGQDANAASAQAAYEQRAKCTGAARAGEYSPEMEREAAAA
ncbi:MAG: fructose-bisphosphate aldolase class I [Actinomycetota bacterium]|nr:fructose-bisphosphate aldolase class I [Actinomycetota bacterium]